MNETKELAEAVHCLRHELTAWREMMLQYLHSHLVTHQDLHEAKREILKAIGDRVDPARVKRLTGELKESGRRLAKVTQQNQPKLSG